MIESKGQNAIESGLNKFINKFKKITKNPETLLSTKPKKAEETKIFLKELYDFTNQQETECSPDFLPELQVEDLDDEQIWQQLELKNESMWKTILEESSKFLSLHESTLSINFKSVNDLSEGSQDKDDDDEDNENDDDNDDDVDEDGGNDQEDIDYFEGKNDEDENKIRKQNRFDKVKIIPSVVDDKFFKLSELEAFLNAEDKNEASRLKKIGKFSNSDNSNEDGIDYFGQDLGHHEESNDDYRYEDFFDEMENDTKNKTNNGKDYFVEDGSEEEEKKDDDIYESEKIVETFNENDDQSNPEEEDESNLNLEEEIENADDDFDEKNDYTKNYVKSSFEQRQERLRLRINDLEEKALSEKPWQLKGEITAQNRPHNSLLEEVLEYDSNIRPAPVITEKTNQTLEEIIRQRIVDKSWDDVKLSIRPIQTPHELKKKLILDHEKSKQSLAQVYENEYQKEVAKLTTVDDNEEEEPKEHKEIKQMINEIFKKLDALSNFHFIPKPVAPEPRIITNTPAVQMEEVAPILVSDAKLLAPEEIKAPAKGEILGKSERTKTDKNRERRHKKLRQQAIYKAKEKHQLEKQSKGIELTTKEEKQKMFRNVIKNRNVSKATESLNSSSIKTSKAFFTQLQDNSSGLKIKRKKNTKGNENLSAKKLKL